MLYPCLDCSMCNFIAYMSFLLVLFDCLFVCALLLFVISITWVFFIIYLLAKLAKRARLCLCHPFICLSFQACIPICFSFVKFQSDRIRFYPNCKFFQCNKIALFQFFYVPYSTSKVCRRFVLECVTDVTVRYLSRFPIFRRVTYFFYFTYIQMKQSILSQQVQWKKKHISLVNHYKNGFKAVWYPSVCYKSFKL